jgi:hypothetical protein
VGVGVGVGLAVGVGVGVGCFPCADGENAKDVRASAASMVYRTFVVVFICFFLSSFFSEICRTKFSKILGNCFVWR